MDNVGGGQLHALSALCLLVALLLREAHRTVLAGLFLGAAFVKVNTALPMLPIFRERSILLALPLAFAVARLGSGGPGASRRAHRVVIVLLALVLNSAEFGLAQLTYTHDSRPGFVNALILPMNTYLLFLSLLCLHFAEIRPKEHGRGDPPPAGVGG
jgi:hypothetical protein